jgi:uncharacterized protein YjbI with pentapeptide repeats
MATFERRVFDGQTVVLDGQVFNACDFRNCRLVYKGSETVTMERCNISDCRFDFEDAALRTVTFMQALYHSSPAGQKFIDNLFNIRSV